LDVRDTAMLNWPIEEDVPSFKDLSPTEEIVDGQDRSRSSFDGSTSTLSSSDLSKIAQRAVINSRQEMGKSVENRFKAMKPAENNNHSDEKMQSPRRERLSIAKKRLAQRRNQSDITNENKSNDNPENEASFENRDHVKKTRKSNSAAGTMTQGRKIETMEEGELRLHKDGINDNDIPETVHSLIVDAMSQDGQFDESQVGKSSLDLFNDLKNFESSETMQREFNNPERKKNPQRYPFDEKIKSSGNRLDKFNLNPERHLSDEKMKSVGHPRSQNACDITVDSNTTTKQANGRIREELVNEGRKNEEYVEDVRPLFPREPFTNDLTAINEGDIGGDFTSKKTFSDMQENMKYLKSKVHSIGKEQLVSQISSSTVKNTDENGKHEMKIALHTENQVERNLVEGKSEVKNSDNTNRSSTGVRDSTQHSRISMQSEEYGDSSTLTKSTISTISVVKGGKNSSSSEEESNINSLVYSSYDESIKERHTDESTSLLGALLSSEDDSKDGPRKDARKHEVIAQIVNGQEQNELGFSNESLQQPEGSNNSDALNWWQKKYAINQNDDINRMVKNALSPSTSDDGFKVVPIKKDRWNIRRKKKNNLNEEKLQKDNRSSDDINQSQKQSKMALTDFENEFITQPWHKRSSEVGNHNSSNNNISNMDGFRKNQEGFSDEDSGCSGSLFSGIEDSTFHSKSSDFRKAKTRSHNRDPLSLTQTSRASAFPPPPPPPPQVPFERVLDGSQVDTVNSDITSSLINGDVDGTTNNNWVDWNKKSTSVITEEASADITADTESEKPKIELQTGSKINTSGSDVKKSNSALLPNASSPLGSMANTSHKSSTVITYEDDIKSISSSQASNMKTSKDSLNVQSKENMEAKYTSSASSSFLGEDDFGGFGLMFMNILDTVSNFCSAPVPARSTGAGAEEGKSFDEKANDMSDGQSINTANDSVLSVQSTMNEMESQKWDEWDRLNSEARAAGSTGFFTGGSTNSFTDEEFTDGETFFSNNSGTNTPTSYSSGGAMSTKNQKDVRRKQATAHQKLVTYSKLALTASSQDSGNLSKNRSGTACTSSPSRSETSLSNNGINPAGSDNEVKPRTVLGPTSKVLTMMDSTFSLNQRRIFEKFCDSLRNKGMEVLKKNRDSKWQMRYLTFSKEQTEIRCVKLSHKERETGYCPTALLWVKRFNSRSKDHSLSLIDKQGKGGVLVSEIVRINANTTDFVVPKKYQAKYQHSVAVLVEYNLSNSVRTMTLLCKTKNEAHFLCTGARVCMDVLKREREGLMAIAAKGKE